jgi:hypothetical protein
VVKDEYSLKDPTGIAFGTTPKSALIFNKARVAHLLNEYKFIYGTFGVVSQSL